MIVRSCNLSPSMAIIVGEDELSLDLSIASDLPQLDQFRVQKWYL